MNRTSHDWSYMQPVDAPVDRSDYLKSFNSLMESRMQARRNTVDWRRRSRINLPSLEENEESLFCMLDPMTASVSFIDEVLKESTEGLRKNSDDAKILARELNDLRAQT